MHGTPSIKMPFGLRYFFILQRKLCGEYKCSNKLFAKIASYFSSRIKSSDSMLPYLISNPLFFPYATSSLVMVIPVLPFPKRAKNSPKEQPMSKTAFLSKSKILTILENVLDFDVFSKRFSIFGSIVISLIQRIKKFSSPKNQQLRPLGGGVVDFSPCLRRRGAANFFHSLQLHIALSKQLVKFLDQSLLGLTLLGAFVGEEGG